MGEDRHLHKARCDADRQDGAMAATALHRPRSSSPALRGLVRARNGTVGTGNEAARDPGRRLCARRPAAARSHLLRPRRAAPARCPAARHRLRARGRAEGRPRSGLCSASRAARGAARGRGPRGRGPRPCRANARLILPRHGRRLRPEPDDGAGAAWNARAVPAVRRSSSGSPPRSCAHQGKPPEGSRVTCLLRSMLWHSDNAAANARRGLALAGPTSGGSAA